MMVYQNKQGGFSDSSEYRVLRGFVNRGHKVHLLIPREVGIPKDLFYSGIFIHEFKMPHIQQAKSQTTRLILTLFYYCLPFLFIIRLIKRLAEVMEMYGKPDVVYGYASEGCLAAYVIGRLLNVPNISRIYGTFLYTHLSRPLDFFKHLSFFELIAFKIPCKYLIITNDGTRGDETAKRLKVPAERVRYWMNGVDFLKNADIEVGKARKELGISPETHVMISICRLAWWKRVDRLIETLPLIASADSHAKLLILGEGDQRQKLELLSDALGVKKLLSFLGAVPHSAVEKYLRISDLFLSFYDFSNMSSSLLEAMACGTCVVALNSGTTGQVIANGENGVLIDYDDLETISKVLIHLLKDDDLRRKLGRNARQFAVKNFKSWDQRVGMEIELIEGLFK
jgi:glycosyltransferase involved in cell wall biosynthesis